jgi:hypothetical protein
VVRRHETLTAFELIIEELTEAHAVVLFAGPTHGDPRRFQEHRLTIDIEVEEDWTYQVATVLVSEELERGQARVPRWFNRKPATP